MQVNNGNFGGSLQRAPPKNSAFAEKHKTVCALCLQPFIFDDINTHARVICKKCERLKHITQKIANFAQTRTFNNLESFFYRSRRRTRCPICNQRAFFYGNSNKVIECPFCNVSIQFNSTDAQKSKNYIIFDLKTGEEVKRDFYAFSDYFELKSLKTENSVFAENLDELEMIDKILNL